MGIFMHKLAVFLLLVSAVCPCVAAEPATKLTGVVTDSEGAVVRGAYVYVHWDQSGATVGLADNVGIKHDLTLLTDQKGEFMAEVPPGFYDLFVAAAGFSPECRKVRLKVGRIENYKIALRADPLVTGELGDTIPK